MDRFIATKFWKTILQKCSFKIQYGQIYRNIQHSKGLEEFILKSNMDRFIDKAFK